MPDTTTALVISDTNNSYKTVDGVLYSKNGSYLIYYPTYKTDISFTVPSDVKVVLNNAFSNCFYLQAVVFNSPVTIMNEAFKDSKVLSSVTFTSESPSALTGMDIFAGCHEALVIYVPEASIDLYKENIIVDTDIRAKVTAISTEG